MARFTCVYLGFIFDIAGAPEELIDREGMLTLAQLIDLLDSIHPGFKEVFIDPKTQKPVPSRQILVTPSGKWTGPPAKGFETEMEDGMRVIFW